MTYISFDVKSLVSVHTKIGTEEQATALMPHIILLAKLHTI